MLAYFLATIMAIISLVLFLNAFISPKTHRQDDFLWSALGLFYALILWICANRFTGAILLGQVAGVAITISFIWENRQLRKVVTAESDSNELLEGFSILNFVGQSLAKISSKKKTPQAESPESVVSPETSEVIDSETPSSEKDKDTVTSELASETVTEEKQEEEISSEQTEETDKEKISAKEERELEKVDEEMRENLEEESAEELLGSSLTKEKDIKASSNSNIFSRLFGIFRKSEPEKPEISSTQSKGETEEQDIQEALSEIETLDDEKLAQVEESEQDESLSEDIDLKTTSREVEEVIDNLELSESLDDGAQPEDSSDVTASQEQTELAEKNEGEAVDSTPVEEHVEEKNEREEKPATSESNVETEVVQEAEDSNNETPASNAETPDEDDIIESLSDLFPKPNDVEGESKSSSDEPDEKKQTN